MRGFLSLEEHYASDLKAYYDNLQMGLPVNFYDGRHDPDHTPWLEYFVGTMARAAEELHKKATAREWLGKWRDDGFVQPAKGGVQRVRAYVLAPEWAGVLGEALDSVDDKDG